MKEQVPPITIEPAIIQDITNMAASPRKKKADSKGTAPVPGPTTPTKTTPSSARECDYDANPTQLYKSIEAKNWEVTSQLADIHPEQVATWVSRKETSGKLRWRLLPLHAAIVFHGPEKVVENLLAAYPFGAQCKDDQGMLPIHLAFRTGASEGVVNLLLVAYPQSINVKDRKGRIPLVLAQASSSANKEAFLRILERGPSYYAVAAAATERAAVTAEQKSIYDAKVMQIDIEHKKQIAALEQEKKDIQIKCEEKIATFESEVDSSKNMCNVLSDHISALEAQLESRGDAELLLANKCKKLEELSKSLQKERDGLEIDLNVEKRLNEELEEKTTGLEDELADISRLYQEKCDELSKFEKENDVEKEKSNQSLTDLRSQLTTAQSTIMALDSRLKKRMAVENSLSTQLTEMARQAAELAASKAVAEAEREVAVTACNEKVLILENEVTFLKGKLEETKDAMGNMVHDHEQLILASSNHDELMVCTAEKHATVLEEMMQYESTMKEQVEERDRILAVLQSHEAKAQEVSKQREHLREQLQAQSSDFSKVSYLRNMMIDCVSKQKEEMNERLNVLEEALSGEKEEERITEDETREAPSSATEVFMEEESDEEDILLNKFVQMKPEREQAEIVTEVRKENVVLVETVTSMQSDSVAE